MANPITPSGRRRISPIESFDGGDIGEAARRQDEERRIREDNAYFERTGINRPPIRENSPLVDNDRPDIANDGDSYDERFRGRDFVENNPSRIIDPDAISNNVRRNNWGRGTPNIITTPRNEREAYVQREQIKQDKEFQEKVEKTKKKFRNAISGLEINED